MKIKLLGTLALSSALILTACGQEDNEKEKDNKTETTNKSEKKDKQKKSDDMKEKQEDKSKEDTVKQNNEQQEIQVNEQQQVNQTPPQQEPSHEEQMRANAEVAKQNGYTGIPNGDMMATDQMEAYYQQERAKEETKKAQEVREQQLQEEYFELSDRMYEDDVSDEEYEAMEKRQNEILDQVEPIN